MEFIDLLALSPWITWFFHNINLACFNVLNFSAEALDCFIAEPFVTEKKLRSTDYKIMLSKSMMEKWGFSNG